MGDVNDKLKRICNNAIVSYLLGKKQEMLDDKRDILELIHSGELSNGEFLHDVDVQLNLIEEMLDEFEREVT